MTDKAESMKHIAIIKVEEPSKCSVCGSVEECRPYGKDGASVCFDCGMKEEAECKKQFAKRFE